MTGGRYERTVDGTFGRREDSVQGIVREHELKIKKGAETLARVKHMRFPRKDELYRIFKKQN